MIILEEYTDPKNNITLDTHSVILLNNAGKEIPLVLNSQEKHIIEIFISQLLSDYIEELKTVN